MDKQIILELSREFDSFYLYDEAVILRQAERLKRCFPSMAFLYSVKCNPNPRVLACLASQGFGADAASLAEVRQAELAGVPRKKILYSAPGKTRKDIAGVAEQGVLIADSLGEVDRIREEARRRGCTIPIGIRVNPEFTMDGCGGMPSKFGIDEDKALKLAAGELDGVKIVGLHVHVKSQVLDKDLLGDYFQNIFSLARRFQPLCPLEFLNLGSGIGIPYGAGDTELDLEALGETVETAAKAFRRQFPDTELYMETGRYVVCQAGVYCTKVLDRKESRARTYLILKNTLNGFLRPALAKVIAGCGKELGGVEPLFTCRDAVSFLALKEGEPERVTLAGNLCTAADVVAEDVLMPRLEEGDTVLMTNAGSYAAVLSPMQFSMQEPPVELYITASGKILL